MARRRSLNRRWSRRSVNGSAVLDQDSNYIDEEDDTFWRHLPDQSRYSTRASVNASREAFLNSNSRIIDDDDIEATEWWNHLQKTSQDLLTLPQATTRTEVSNSDSANVSNSTSHSDVNSITEAIKKKRIMLGAKRKSSGKNPFSQALNSSDVTVESEPILALKRKDISQNLSKSVEEGTRQSKRSRISNKSGYSPESNTSTDTEKRSRVRPVLFRRPKQKSSSAFDKILLEDDSIVEPSQSLNVNKNKTFDDGNNVQEGNEDTNKTKEFMTQPRSPFDKIRRLSRKSKSNIIIESQENKDHKEISQNLITQRISQKLTDNSTDDENNETSEDATENKNPSIKNKSKHSYKQNSDSDINFKLRLSDGKISEDDKLSPTRSRRRSQISSSSSSESEIIEIRKSNHSSKQVNHNLSDKNNTNSVETIRSENKSKKSYSQLSSTDKKLNTQKNKSSIISPGNKNNQENLSNKTSSTESLFEVPKSGFQNSEPSEQSNSQSILNQNESSDHESYEQVEFDGAEYNEDSNDMSEKSIQKSSARISNNKTKQSLNQQTTEISQHDDENETESSLGKERCISYRKSSTSLKQRMIDNSLNNHIKESNFEKQRISNNENNDSLKKRTTQRVPLIHDDEEHLESEKDPQNNNTEKISESSKNRQSQLNLSIDKNSKDEVEKSPRFLKNRRTKETSVKYRDKEQESDKESDEAEKLKKSLKNRHSKTNSLIDEDKDEDEGESESTKEKENTIEEIQESIKQRKLSSMQSISRKLFSENLEDKSSIMTESSKKSTESNISINNRDPSAYELPDRNRSDSYSESDTDNVHKRLMIAENEQSITDNNIDLPGPSTNVQTPLPSTSTNPHSKFSKKSEPLKMNTLDRYFLNLKSKLGQSEDTQLSQEQLQTLEDKLKKIKEKTDKITEVEVKRVHERTAKLQNSIQIKPTARKNLGNLKNKNKTPQKPVNKAYVVDGVLYKQPKLPRPQKWATNRLYKFLWKKMEPKYNLDTRRKSEKFVQYLSDVVKVIKRRKNFQNYEDDLNELIKKMAQLGIIETRMDFHNFCFDFLPYEFRVKVTPMLMPGNVTNIPFKPDVLTVPIINEQ